MFDWFWSVIFGGQERLQGVSKFPTTYDKTMGVPEAAEFAAAVRGRRYDAAQRLYDATPQELQELLVHQLSIESPGDDEAVSAWYAEAPENPLACILSTSMMIDLAWERRSSYAAKDVSQEQWQGFRETLNAMQPLMAHLREVAADDPQAWIISMHHQMGLGSDMANATHYYERGCAINPTHRGVNSSYLTYILPKWFGSVDRMWAHVKHLQTTYPGTHLESLVTTAWLEHAMFLRMRDRKKEAYDVSADTDTHQAIVDAYLRTNLTSSQLYDAQALNHFAYALWHIKRHDLAVDALKRLNGRYTQSHWWQHSTQFPDGPRDIQRLYIDLARKLDESV